MNETPTAPLDQAAFQRVWRRVMPQDRADCPFTLEELPLTPAPQPLVRAPLAEASVQALAPQPVPIQALPPQAIPCLGEASAGELPALKKRMDAAALSRNAYRSLPGRRRQGIAAALAAAKDRQLRRLGAAYFLISGQDYTPAQKGGAGSSAGALALRERFRAEQAEAADLMDAARDTGDPCLSQLYRELAEENHGFADRIRSRLEQGRR